MRYTFEILAMGLLMAAGSVLYPAMPRPAISAASSGPVSTAPAPHTTVAAAQHINGGRG
jgi:hypothetical protein